MLSFVSMPTSFAPVVHTMGAAQRAPVVKMETAADLAVLAEKCNPTLKFWDPLGLVSATNLDEETFIGWLRHSEIKHGRVAMAAFVGYIVQANGIHFPWALTTSGVTYADISAAGSPQDQWDALPTASKLSLLGGIAFLELWGENSKVLEMEGQKHYCKGGKPGYYPTFAAIRDSGLGQPPLDLFDPFKLQKKMTPEQKEKSLVAEINNGRLAQLGIMAFVSESKVPGSVPGLAGVGIPSYSGECMAPFTANDVSLPFVKEMLAWSAPF